MKNQKSKTIAASEIENEFPRPGTFDHADNFIDRLDHKKIAKIEGDLKDLKEKNSNKFYAVKLSPNILHGLIDFISTHAEWVQTESLGIIEIHKTLMQIKDEGVKNDTIFMKGLPITALHYFLSKQRGKGLKEAKTFISLYKPISLAHSEVEKDNLEIQNLEKELAAAQQGIEAI